MLNSFIRNESFCLKTCTSIGQKGFLCFHSDIPDLWRNPVNIRPRVSKSTKCLLCTSWKAHTRCRRIVGIIKVFWWGIVPDGTGRASWGRLEPKRVRAWDRMTTGYNTGQIEKNKNKSQSGKRMKSTFLSHNNNNNDYIYWFALEQGTGPPTAQWLTERDWRGRRVSGVSVCVNFPLQMWFDAKSTAGKRGDEPRGAFILGS